MMKKNGCRILAGVLILTGMTVCGGCRETPDESAVVSRKGGLREETTAEPLPEGEMKTVEMPQNWEQTETWNKDRWIFRADVELESFETGNLPVVEMKQHSMTQEELVKLTEYFSQGEELYLPFEITREVYQEKLDRIRGMEGVYAVYTIDTIMGYKADMLEEALDLAPAEGEQTAEKAEIAFGPWQDTAEDAITDRREYISEETDAMDLYFSADIGAERSSRIEARKYDPQAGLSGTFEWSEGDKVLYARTDLDMYRYFHSPYASLTETDQKWEQILDQCAQLMEEENIDADAGRGQAEELLKELGITDKVYSYAEPVLWFPDGTYPEDVAYTYYDSLWQADLSQAEAGYVYTFNNSIGSWPVDLKFGGYFHGAPEAEEETQTYAPPFPVEKIQIVVTGGGIRMFSWDGMSETVATVAENTNLLPFEEIQERLTQYLSYCFPAAQPDDSESVFEYDLQNIRFGYSYIPAYESPDHAWAVPAWFAEIKSGSDNYDLTGKKEIEEMQWCYVTISALDGSIIDNW